MQTGRI